ncbi:serine hydrolase domain-containing protein [Pedobacter heparinus]|uniref:Beta-lactamase n=1 Tax=Pedobacter heparinus (strain ATCC 13125 / DSM 2366 / CIP 104194 / JCM 7457 / NBRC 12017 / NCIMB 9290 / NRRL B-14731 / HIM 762-3) TaxID=485917 RepID=C6XZC3_PEDHD|nr:serine hydrolase domain-containing protein [Pedobacter heparinus]ACU04619.1 beta-lactamase [Pedobacter heparinus DSM 2366]
MLKITSFFLLIFTVASAASAQSPATFNKLKLDSLIETVGAKDKAMMSIAVMQNGKMVYSKAVGYAIADTKIPATPETKYRIGSITKVFTGTVIFQLIQEGKLSLTTTLATFFPALPNADKITMAHLLNHSSGLFNLTSDPGYASILGAKLSQADLLARFQHAPVFEPGAKNEYSNTNFILLGFIIEKLDKKSYAASVKSRIIDKIGLKNTYYGGPINPANNEARSYKWKEGWVAEQETDMSIPGAAGAMVANPGDLVQFFNALFTGKLISEASLLQMEKITNGYGMAMFKMSFGEHSSYGHTGGIDGFQSQAAYFPENKMAIAITANGVNTSLNDVAIGVLSILFNKPYVIPTFSNLKLKNEDLNKYLGTYASDKMPLKITITSKDAVLYAQATGQSAFPLVAAKPDVFTFESAGINLTFDVANNQMTFRQGGATFVMTKEK